MNGVRIVLLASLVTVLGSCKSDTVTIQDREGAQYSLQIKPDTLRLLRYDQGSFVARTNGVAESDVYYHWDFNDSTDNRPSESNSVQHVFLLPGVHVVHATSYDYFTDTLIATGVAYASIRDTAHSLTLHPHAVDTALQVGPNGTFDRQFESDVWVETSRPTPDLLYSWHLISSTIDSAITHSSITNYLDFDKPGEWKVVVTAYDNLHQLFGADSMTILLRAK